MNDLLSFYSRRAEIHSTALSKVKKRLFYISVLRLMTFSVFLLFTYLFFKNQETIFIAASIAFLAVFLFLIKKSADLNIGKKLLENLLFVNINEVEILQGEPNRFNNGQFAHSFESYYADLDIFGEASLYHALNRTATKVGGSALANLLKHTFTDAKTIVAQQVAIKALSQQNELREQLIAKSLINKSEEDNVDNIESWLQGEAKFLLNRWISIARYLLPVINIITLIISFYVDHYLFLITSVLITWMHLGFVSKYIQQQHNLLGKKQDVLEQYTGILQTFEVVDARDSLLLLQLQELAADAHLQVKKLSTLSNLLDQRLNLLVNLFLNSFFMYDVQVMIGLEKWKLKNKTHFSSWIECVAKIESLTSLATFAFNNPEHTYPTLSDEFVIESTGLAHPLISKNERVKNDLLLGRTGKLLLVTGSNMSGKTTYLRTIGINVVLAQCGAPVCANAFTFMPVDIYTSIRISDSLHEHTSYFTAELKRLSQIKESISTNKPSLVLIDEILRGTNSEDKYFGSAAFVKKLIEYNALTLFATHDLKLSELEDEHIGLVENYCFESVIAGDELVFDYKVKRGVAQNKNASFLMKKMKII